MKKCKECGINEKIHHRSRCSECHYKSRLEYTSNNKFKFTKYNREYRREVWYPKQKDGIYKVYILPNSNYYVGQCEVISVRMDKHRCDGRNTDDYIILHRCDTREEAKWYESVYHKLGFPGYNNGL